VGLGVEIGEEDSRIGAMGEVLNWLKVKDIEGEGLSH